MATRDKYYFQQITQDWGAIEYRDVPSYSKTSVGTTGDAYLIRQFLKQFFPFLKTSVNKSSQSVRVKVQEFVINFTWEENGVSKRFVLGARSLDDILQPLFEGQGFDGMTDSSYTKPLPKMYNDEGFEVSYGYIYLFVDPENLSNAYEVGLDDYTITKKGVRSYRSLMAKDGSQLRFEMPEKTFNFIKGFAGANSNASSQTTNQSDLVTLERGEENQNMTDNGESLTTLEQEIIDFLADKNLGVELIRIRNFFLETTNYVDSDVNRAMSDLLQKELINNNQSSNSGLLYILTPKGKSYITPKQPSLDNQNDPDQIVFDSKNKSTLTTGDIAAIEFITQNYTILKDMEKESPELYNGISEGLRLIMSLTKDGTGQLEPFKPLENQQQLVDQEKEYDFDLSEVDLEEIDLTGLEDDLELNDDELGDVDLTEFDELSDFVESELMPSPSQNDRLYAILKTVELMQLTDKLIISTKKILESVNFNNQQKYTLQEIDVLEDNGFMERSSIGITLSTKGQDFINEYELKNKQVPSSIILTLPVDIENLDALQKNILMILDKPPAQGKGRLYNEMDQSEIWAEVDETIANEYLRNDVKYALDVLIGLKLVTELNHVPVEYRLTDDKRTSEIIANIKNELSPLTPTVEKILRILYRFTGKLSADNIKDDLSNMNIILPHKAIFSRLIALRDRGLVREINTSYGGIVWQITPLGNEYVDKLPKEKTGRQIREEEKQAKIEKDFGSLDYDFYLVLKILNDTMGMLTAGTVTTILQQQFNKKPKWDEFAVLSKLRGLLSMGLALEDIQNSTEYFEISDYGEDVFKYLSEQESKGLYPKSKPTEQTVAVRPSPTESATLNSVGTIKKGNDGNNWEVKESSKGVKRWVKIK
jgi:Fe2+ or Zn2+ uptake regulation protein